MGWAMEGCGFLLAIPAAGGEMRGVGQSGGLGTAEEAVAKRDRRGGVTKEGTVGDASPER